MATLRRFRGDLWQCDRVTLDEACKGLVTERTQGRRTVVSVYRGSGLYVQVLTAGEPFDRVMILSEGDIRDYVWRVTNG